jgi:hypothetical protein
VEEVEVDKVVDKVEVDKVVDKVEDKVPVNNLFHMHSFLQ